MALKILDLEVADFMSPRPITVKDNYGAKILKTTKLMDILSKINH
ncbi:MAG: hypothetical protein ABI340_09985 [Nitrososphaera sp.]|jgi:hypothetical protein